ncbi:MAG: hypothetical protein V3S89_03300 [Desulfobacterales bacterium]
MTQRAFVLFVGVVSLLAGQGCMKVGPDYHRPDIVVTPPEGYQHGPSGKMEMEPASDRW